MFIYDSVVYDNVGVRYVDRSASKDAIIIFYCCTVHFDNTYVLLPTNALLYYTYKMLKCTVKISHDCSYMFRSTWTIIRELMPNLAKVTILCRYSVKIRR